MMMGRSKIVTSAITIGHGGIVMLLQSQTTPVNV
jgi:hypothetical protein